MQPVEQNVRELTIPELDQIAGGVEIRDINVGIGQINVNTGAVSGFGIGIVSENNINIGVGRLQGGLELG